jgi:hypothetical protein
MTGFYTAKIVLIGRANGTPPPVEVTVVVFDIPPPVPVIDQADRADDRRKHRTRRNALVARSGEDCSVVPTKKNFMKQFGSFF